MAAADILDFAQTAVTRPPIDVDDWNFAAMYKDGSTRNGTFDQNEQK